MTTTDRRLVLERMLEWCAAINEKPWVERSDWWYHVGTRDDGGYLIVRSEGIHAIEMRKRARGETIEYYRPTPEDVAAIHDFVARCIEQGMTQKEFNEYVQRTGGCPRV